MTRRELVEIDLRGVCSEGQMHEALSAALEFPGWYGNNANALWDAITGLVDMPVTLRFRHWSDFEHRLPTEAIFLRDLLAEMSLKLPSLASNVIYR